MLKAHIWFHNIVVVDQGFNEDWMVADVAFDYEAAGWTFTDLVARVKSAAGASFETDPIEVVLPPEIDGPINYAQLRDKVEAYYRSAFGSGGWAIRVDATSSNIRIQDVVADHSLVVDYDFDSDRSEPTAVTAEDCSAPAIPPPDSASPFRHLRTVEGVDFRDTTIYLDGRLFRDCTFDGCKIVIEYGAFRFQWISPQTRPAFTNNTFVTQGNARNIWQLMRAFPTQSPPEAAG